MKRQNKPLIIGLKYCGGCKPNYDRVAMVEHIRQRIAPMARLVPPDSEPLDLVLAVQGCPTACADVAPFGNIPIFTMTAPEDVDRFIDFLNTQLQ